MRKQISSTEEFQRAEKHSERFHHDTEAAHHCSPETKDAADVAKGSPKYGVRQRHFHCEWKAESLGWA